MYKKSYNKQNVTLVLKGCVSTGNVKNIGEYLVNFFLVDILKDSSPFGYVISKFPPYYFLQQLPEKILYIDLRIKLLKAKVNAAKHKIISIAPKLY